jgi:carbonic anhydrase
MVLPLRGQSARAGTATSKRPAINHRCIGGDCTAGSGGIRRRAVDCSTTDRLVERRALAFAASLAYECSVPHTWDPLSLPPETALQRLADGNRRFREGLGGAQAVRGLDAALAAASQRPFAIVLGCSDSRTPVEIVFDQGFGDLFVVRVAGNIVAPSIVGSIEFAASQFGTRLVVVMGHTGCGAVAATLQALATGLGPESKNLRAIIDRIAPHVGPHVDALARQASPAAIREAVRANVRASVSHLRHGSQILEELVLKGRVAVVGAEYELETGQVRFFDY